jgi:hypothetical protein
MTAIDGSDASHDAYVLAKNLMKEGDHIIVGHVFNPDKDYLPFNLQPEYIRKTYEPEIVGFGKHGSILWEQLQKDANIK